MILLIPLRVINAHFGRIVGIALKLRKNILCLASGLSLATDILR